MYTKKDFINEFRGNEKKKNFEIERVINRNNSLDFNERKFSFYDFSMKSFIFLYFKIFSYQKII